MVRSQLPVQAVDISKKKKKKQVRNRKIIISSNYKILTKLQFKREIVPFRERHTLSLSLSLSLDIEIKSS